MTSREHDDDRVAQYVAGTLSAGEAEEFEQHLLTCGECRAAVHLGAATRAALVRQPAGVPATVSSLRAWRRMSLPFAGVLAAAIVVLVATGRDAPVDPLGSVEPAPFVAGALRASMDSIAALVDSGMIAYGASDFGTAAERLERASRNDTSAAVRFFLGVSMLMRGNEDAALRALQQVSLESVYGGEAAYYTAKALVRLQRVDSAIAVLERASRSGVTTQAHQAFADSLRRR